MHERQRDEPSAAGGGPGPGGEGLPGIRAAADELLTAGDEAIRRALSADHQAFNRANRQESGQ
jgi:hypothetical protein